MELLNTLKSYFSKSPPIETRSSPDISVPLSQATPELLGWSRSDSQYITHEQALTVSAYYAAIRTISEEIGAFPRHLYRKDQAKSRIEITDSPAAKLLRNPNPLLYTSFTFWQTLTKNALQYGNGYAQIIKQGATPKSLVLIHPTNVTPKVVGEQLVYEIKENGVVKRTLTADQILHVLGFTDNGLIGIPAIQYHAQTLNTGRFANEFTANFFENGANPSGVLRHPQALSPEASKKLRQQFAEKYSGSSQSHKPMLLEEGLTWEPTSVDPEKSQLIELKKYNVEDIARIFRIPLSKLQNNDKANYNSLEAENTAFVQETLLPWCRKIEEEFERKVVEEAEQGTIFCRFLLDGRARGTLAERNSAYTAGRNGGWLSANDIRQLENQERIPGGDEYLVPLNMVSAKSQPIETRSGPAPAPPGGSSTVTDSGGTGTQAGSNAALGSTGEKLKLLPQAEATAKNLASKEAKALTVALKAPTPLERLANYKLFIQDHTKLVAEKFAPLIATAAELQISLPDLSAIYLKASESVFNERIETELSTDEWIAKITKRFTDSYKE